MLAKMVRKVSTVRRLRLPRSSAAIIAVVATVAWTVVNPAPTYAQQPIGAARIVVRNVTGTLPATREPVVLRVGVDVFQNEVIDTAANSTTLLAFQDRTELSVCPSTEIVLDRADPARSEVAVSIPSGCARFQSGLLLKTAIFNTPSASIRTSGTLLTITVSRRGGTTVSVADGIASVTGAGRTVTVGAGQSTLVLRGQPPTPPVPAPPAPPIVTEMNTLLAAATPDFGTRAAARSPYVEAPHGANMYSPNVDAKILSEIANDPTSCNSKGTHGSRGTHGACGSRGTHGSH
jgi:FecR protein